MLLHIALQEGFRGEPVVVEIGGRERFRKPNVETRTQIGYADSFELSMDESPSTIVVSLPNRGIREPVVVDLKSNLYVGVSVTPANEIQFRIQPEPFGYV